MNDRTESISAGSWQSSHLNDDECLGLAHGLLPRPAAERLLAHLDACPECELRFRTQVTERERLRARGSLRTRSDGRAIFEPHSGRREPASERLAPPLWSSLCAALRRPALQLSGGLAVIAAACLIILWPHGPTDQLPPGLMQLQPYIERAGVLMGEESRPAQDDFMEGMRSYDRGELAEAIEFLESATVSAAREPYRRAFLGSALAMCDRHAEAIAALWPLTDAILAEEWRGDVYQTLVISLKACGEVAKADSLLRSLPDWELPPEALDRIRRVLHESGAPSGGQRE